MSTALTRQLRRVALDSRWTLPPTFLCPWTASLSTETCTTSAPPPPLITSTPEQAQQASPAPVSPLRTPPSIPAPPNTLATQAAPPPVDLSPSVRHLLPLLRAQPQVYITAHIHAFPYLVTQGDVIRLPFVMHGVEPGDVLRLNRAVNLGSRDFTLRAAAWVRRGKSVTSGSTPLEGAPTPGDGRAAALAGEGIEAEDIFVPHMAKGRIPYLDERLFVCRAVVMGVESEPLRIKEKTKKRQRHIKHVKSKHRYTVIRIKEVRVRSVEEIESGNEVD